MNFRHVWRPAVVAASFLLGSCETLRSIDFNPEPEIPPPCPRAVVADGAGRLTRFAGAGQDPADVAFEAEIVELTGTCGYDDESIDVEMQIQIAAARGPAATGDVAAFSYFVAIARTDKTVLAREGFDASIELVGNQTRNGIIEEVDQTIPLKEDETGVDFVILVGFEMTPAEFEYNREQNR
jgi:hypothetical protein